LKPDPGNSQQLFINSLSALGIDVTAHDIRFVEDNWESPVMCEPMFYAFSISFSFSLYSQRASV
jgi:hypothetical protein